MIAGTDRAQTGRSAVPLASLLARVRQHPWATGAAAALDKLNRAGEAVWRDPQQRWADLMGSMRDRIEAGNATLVVVIDHLGEEPDLPPDTVPAEPARAAWTAFADTLNQARMPALIVWAGPPEAVAPVRQALPGETAPTTCTLEPLAGEERERPAPAGGALPAERRPDALAAGTGRGARRPVTGLAVSRRGRGGG